MSNATLISSNMTKLYRAEIKVKPAKPMAEWIPRSTATGRWFTDDLQEAVWYMEHEYPDGDGHIVYVELPTAEAERFRVSNWTDNQVDQPRAYSCRPDKEFFVTAEMASMKKPL
jgi:hypothetical protein